jgi:tight adherence protein B
VTAGPVAATALGAYGAAGVVVMRRHAQRRAGARAHGVATDAVVALAADLRAGVPQSQALLAVDSALRRAADLLLPAPAEALLVARRVASAAAVSQASGAPLVDVLERLDLHLRAIDRARALAETQAAGARASAALLAAMPAAGVGLGATIGVDPVRVLLHTTLGGGALCLAVALQLSGLAWTARLARVEVAA